jgi:hypothetical protein
VHVIYNSNSIVTINISDDKAVYDLITHHTMKAHAETEAEHKFILSAKHCHAQYNLKISG